MTPQELVNIIKMHDRFIRGRAGGARADLKHQNLSGLKLPKINLQDASLAGCDFSRCVLANGDFGFADLFGANFEHSDLTRANFFRAEQVSIFPVLTSATQMLVAQPAISHQASRQCCAIMPFGRTQAVLTDVARTWQEQA